MMVVAICVALALGLPHVGIQRLLLRDVLAEGLRDVLLVERVHDALHHERVLARQTALHTCSGSITAMLQTSEQQTAKSAAVLQK